MKNSNPIQSTQNPPPPGEGNRVAVEGVLSINTRKRLAAFAAFSAWALSVGFAATPAQSPADASALFARNLFNFLSAFWDKEAGTPVLEG
jgi:hypothetical protein